MLTRALGESHHITKRFINTSWTPHVYKWGDTPAFTQTFGAVLPVAQGVIDAAIAEMELLGDDAPVSEALYPGHHCPGLIEARWASGSASPAAADIRGIIAPASLKLPKN